MCYEHSCIHSSFKLVFTGTILTEYTDCFLFFFTKGIQVNTVQNISAFCVGLYPVSV